VLPLCFGEATKFAQLGLESAKRYRVVAQFGQATETGDRDGAVVLTMARPIDVTDERVRTILKQFEGVQMQVPSIYSALKYQGRPMYEYARAGIEIPVEPRSIQVFELLFISLTDDQLTFEVHCSKGTYVRSLVADIGQALNWCAHVAKLHRTGAGYFTDRTALSVESLIESPDDSKLKPVAMLLLEQPWLKVVNPSLSQVVNGHPLEATHVMGLHDVQAAAQKSQWLQAEYDWHQALATIDARGSEDRTVAIFADCDQQLAQGFDCLQGLRLLGLYTCQSSVYQPHRLINRDTPCV